MKLYAGNYVVSFVFYFNLTILLDVVGNQQRVLLHVQNLYQTLITKGCVGILVIFYTDGSRIPPGTSVGRD